LPASRGRKRDIGRENGREGQIHMNGEKEKK
jgi:hypothetical protein